MSLSSKIKKFLLFGALLACFGKDGKSQIAIYVISSPNLPTHCSVAQGSIHFKTSGGSGVEGLYFCGPSNDEWTYTGASGSGGVSSISGTINEITASGSTGAITLSIPSTFVAPGTISSTDSIMRGSSSGQVDWASNADGSCLTSTNLTYTFHICYLNNGEFEITDGSGNPGHIYFQKNSYLNPYYGTGANAIPVCGTGGTVHAIGTVSDPVTTTVNSVYVAGGTNNSNYLVSCENAAGTYQWVLLDGSSTGTITGVTAGTGLTGGGTSGTVTLNLSPVTGTGSAMLNTNPSMGTGASSISRTVTAGAAGVTQNYISAKDASNPTLYQTAGSGGCGSGFAAATATSGNSFQLETTAGLVVNAVADGTVTAGHLLTGGSTIPGRVADTGQTGRTSVSSTTCIVGVALSSATVGGSLIVA